MADSAPAPLHALYEKERARLITLDVAAHAGMRDAPVFGAGCMSPHVMLIGEAPGAEETQSGQPFVGKAGKQLDALLAMANIARTDIFITNAVKYRPVTLTRTGMRNRTPTAAEVKEALWLLAEEIALLRPKIIATLGNTPLGALRALDSGIPKNIGAAHGKGFMAAHGGISFTLFPLYHPASVIYNHTLLPVLEADAQALGALARR